MRGQRSGTDAVGPVAESLLSIYRLMSKEFLREYDIIGQLPLGKIFEQCSIIVRGHGSLKKNDQRDWALITS